MSNQRKAPSLRRRLLGRASALALTAGLSVGLLGAPAAGQETIDLATDADVVIQGAEPGGFLLRRPVSGAGDVNGDGFDDLIIGSSSDRDHAGATYVIFGSDRGLPAIIDLATDADVVIQGAAAGDFSGWSVSGAGDVNGDGFDDLLIGAPLATPNGRTYAGASYVVFGAVDLAGIIDLADPVAGADVIIQGAAERNFSGVGYSVSGAGDVNGDGIDDLVVGDRAAAPNGRSYAGESYVVFGATDLSGAIDLADPVNGADLVIQGAAPDDSSGASVSGAGDVNGDGIDDLIIGAFTASPDDRAYAGASYVVFGATDLSGTIDLADPVNGADLIIQGADIFHFSGASVSGAGDVNGDGIDDLIIGSPNASPDGRDYAGASYVILGSEGLPAIIDLADATTGADVVIQGAAPYDSSGRSVSGAGDVNGDGIDDVLIGAPSAAPKDRTGAGASYVLFGTDRGLPPIIDLASDADLIAQGAAAYDFSGSSVSGAGDVDGDGIDDLIIGAPYADPNDLVNAGASYVVFGGPAAAIERLIGRIDAAGLPHGLETSLIKKLENALKDVAKDNGRGANGKLQALINQLEAQRGKQIPAADADAWIADAQAILNMLTAA